MSRSYIITQENPSRSFTITQSGESRSFEIDMGVGPIGPAGASYTLPTATNTILGGVKIGSGVTITDGVISVSTDYAASTHASTHGTGGADELTPSAIGAAAEPDAAKATALVDADRVYIYDSEAANVPKTSLWSIIKSTLKTYFDTLYPLRANNLSDLQSAPSARANLGLSTRVTIGDANVTIAATTRVAATSANLTAPRTWTLPAASAYQAGEEIIISDAFGGVSATNTLTIQRAGSDAINGANTLVMAAAFGWRRLISNGSNAWSFDAGVARTANNLSDLSSAATARTNLGGGAVGQAIFQAATVSVVDTTLGKIRKIRTTDSADKTDSTYATDSVLAGWSVVADTPYRITGILYASMGAGLFKAQVVIPTSKGNGAAGTYIRPNGTVLAMTVSGTDITGIITGSDLDGAYPFTCVFVPSSSGTVNLQWAQSSTNAAATKILAGSFATLESL